MKHLKKYKISLTEVATTVEDILLDVVDDEYITSVAINNFEYLLDEVSIKDISKMYNDEFHWISIRIIKEIPEERGFRDKNSPLYTGTYSDMETEMPHYMKIFKEELSSQGIVERLQSYLKSIKLVNLGHVDYTYKGRYKGGPSDKYLGYRITSTAGTYNNIYVEMNYGIDKKTDFYIGSL